MVVIVFDINILPTQVINIINIESDIEVWVVSKSLFLLDKIKY